MRRSIRPGFGPNEIRLASEYLKSHGLVESKETKGICHGARNGLESDEFKKHFPIANIIGTDLNPMQGKGAYYTPITEIVKWDFSKENPVWIGNMDWVYSNSLDHSATPEETIKTWIHQLKPTGFLFLQWLLENGGVKSGDCFSCSAHELIRMINRTGIAVVTDIIYLQQSRRNTHILIACKPGHPPYDSRQLKKIEIWERKKLRRLQESQAIVEKQKG